MAQDSKATVRRDRQLRLLEAELARTTERFRVAKQASREAKADAKLAKKEMKRARKALIALQATDEQPKAATARRTAAKAVPHEAGSKDSVKGASAARAASASKQAKSPAAVKPAATKRAPTKRAGDGGSSAAARKRAASKKVILPGTIAAAVAASARAANVDLRPMTDADVQPTTGIEGLQQDETT